MARVTTEDCIDKIPNRFDLVMLAAQRAREISTGGHRITVDRDNDRNPVVALREIAEETQTTEELRERLILSHQTQVEHDNAEDDAEDDADNDVDSVVDSDAESGISEEVLLKQIKEDGEQE